MIIHRVFTKPHTDDWKITFGSISDPSGARIIGDQDPKDKLRAVDSKADITYKITSPYLALIGRYTGPDNSGVFRGFERKYIADDNLTVFYVYDTAANTDPISFAQNFLSDITNRNDPVVNDFFEYLSLQNLVDANVIVTSAVQDSNNNITVLYNKTLSDTIIQDIKNAGIETLTHL